MSLDKIRSLIPHFQEYQFEDILDASFPAVYRKDQDYSILILNKADLSNNRFDYLAFVYILYNEVVYTFNRETEELEKLNKNFHSLIDDIDNIYKSNKNILQEYSKEVNHIEDELYDRSISRHFMNMWFDLKKDLSKKERLFDRNQKALLELNLDSKELDKKTKAELKASIAENNLSLNSSQGLLSKLDSIFNYYTSIKNDRLNKNIYVMTILSAIFLPLNLIVGFFGMNTENLIFKNDPDGTYYVLYSLLGIFVLSLIGLNLVKLIDELLLRRILGRYNFYGRITSKIKSIDLFS